MILGSQPSLTNAVLYHLRYTSVFKWICNFCGANIAVISQLTLLLYTTSASLSNVVSSNGFIFLPIFYAMFRFLGYTLFSLCTFNIFGGIDKIFNRRIKKNFCNILFNKSFIFSVKIQNCVMLSSQNIIV